MVKSFLDLLVDQEIQLLDIQEVQKVVGDVCLSALLKDYLREVAKIW